MPQHRDVISIERDADQAVHLTIGQATEGGGSIPGGFSQLFNRVISSFTYARLPEAAKLVYPALVWMADHRRQFVIENRGYGEIARYAGVSRSTAQKGLARLIDAGLARLACPARPDGRGGLTANVYQLLVPIEGIDPMPAYEPPRTVSRTTPVPPKSTPPVRETAQPRPAKRQAAVPGNGRLYQEGESKNQQQPNAAAAKLAAAGIREPVLSNLTGQKSQEELLLRLKDWQTRNASGAKLGVAWLIASIQNGYELHEQTRREIDRDVRAMAATAHRLRELEREADEARRQQELESQVTELLESMSDEELEHWKAVVVAEFPALIKRPERVDARTNDRLRRLILGKLATLISPPTSS